MAVVMEGPILWYLNRGSGAVTMVLLTLTLVLGVLSLGGLSGSPGCRASSSSRCTATPPCSRS